jgi:hypothetical protein
MADLTRLRQGARAGLVYARAVRAYLLGIVALLGSTACGGGAASQPPPAAPASAEPTAPPPTPAAAPAPGPPPAAVPTACADPAASVCTPSGAFVERLCAKARQDYALALFSKDTPFTRLYLRGNMDELVLDEEVLALRFRAPQKGGMVVGSGNGSYEVLRWDGSCSTGVEAEMISRSRPAQPKTALIRWHRIADRIQDALVASSDAVKKAHSKRGKECQGAMSGDVSATCERADRALAAAIVDYVRGHGGLPEPDALP